MRIYLDTNVFIIAVEGDQGSADVVWGLFARAAALKHTLITSELSLAEALVKPFELLDGMSEVPSNPRHLTPGTLVSDLSDLIETKHGLLVQPVDRRTLVGAARVRGDDKAIRLPDAVHVATAQQSECSYFVTSDRRLQERVARFGLTPVDHSGIAELAADLAGPV